MHRDSIFNANKFNPNRSPPESSFVPAKAPVSSTPAATAAPTRGAIDTSFMPLPLGMDPSWWVSLEFLLVYLDCELREFARTESIQFRMVFKRNDKVCQRVVHSFVNLRCLARIFALLRPTDDSIEIAVSFTGEVSPFLQEYSPKPNATVFERFRAVSNEGNINHLVQYMIVVLYSRYARKGTRIIRYCQKNSTSLRKRSRSRIKSRWRRIESLRRALVCVPFRARAFVVIVCWQTYSSLTHIRIENEEKYKAD